MNNQHSGKDYDNYKGIYCNDNKETKYFDPVSGAHFNYSTMFKLLSILKQEREHNINNNTLILTNSRNQTVKENHSSHKGRALESKINIKRQSLMNEAGIDTKVSNYRAYKIKAYNKLKQKTIDYNIPSIKKHIKLNYHKQSRLTSQIDERSRNDYNILKKIKKSANKSDYIKDRGSQSRNAANILIHGRVKSQVIDMEALKAKLLEKQ